MPKQLTFSLQDVAAMMVKSANITSGTWGIYVRFGLQAANMGQGDDLFPVAIVPVVELGIQEMEPCNLTVDAAKVNKQRSKPVRKTTSKKAKR